MVWALSVKKLLPIFLHCLKQLMCLYFSKLMDQRTFVFATRGHWIKGKQCQHITIKNQNISLCSKQSSLFSFYALASGGKSKDVAVH